jgi:uncharacterized protein YbjT (DUF2867 family)
MILVAGAAGLSGSIVMREFARKRIPVRGLVRSRARAEALQGLPGVETVEGNMLRPETLQGAFDGVDQALMISSSGAQMVDTQCTFIDAAKKAGLKRIVKFSGAESGVGFEAKNFRFTRMHEEIERYLERSGIAWTHLRPSQFMQMYFRDAPSIIKSAAIFQAWGDTKLSPVDLEDVAKVALGLLTTNGHEGRSYDMTGPEALTMPQVAEKISEAIDRPIRYVNISAFEKRQAMLNAGVPEYFADAMDELASERRRLTESRVDLSAHEIFGVKPTTFAEFALKYAAVFRGDATLKQ